MFGALRTNRGEHHPMRGDVITRTDFPEINSLPIRHVVNPEFFSAPQEIEVCGRELAGQREMWIGVSVRHRDRAL
jgi:hypothetical protein